MNILHAFYDTHLSLSFAGMQKLLETHAGRGKLAPKECAVFVNRALTAAKILYPTGCILYYRGKEPLTPEALRSLPQGIAKGPLAAAPRVDREMQGQWERRFGKQKQRAVG